MVGDPFARRAATAAPSRQASFGVNARRLAAGDRRRGVPVPLRHDPPSCPPAPDQYRFENFRLAFDPPCDPAADSRLSDRVSAIVSWVAVKPRASVMIST